MDTSEAACNPDRLKLSPREAVAMFFPSLDDMNNHGAEAIRVCRACPIREDCLMEAVTIGTDHGIWGGAGSSRRRALKRALKQGRYEQAATAHFRLLDGHVLRADEKLLLAAYGENATHGRRETYARGCTCDPCAAAASLYTISKTLGIEL